MKKNRRTQWKVRFFITMVMILFLCPSSSRANSRDEDKDKDTVYNYESSEKQISMTVDYGYDHYAKFGRTMSVTVEVTNQGEDFQGWVRAYAPKSENNVVYRQEIYAAAAAKEQIVLNIPLTDDTGLLIVSLQDEKEKTIVEAKSRIKIGNSDNQAYIGILSEEQESLNYFETFATNTFYFDKDNLPSDYLGLDNLDVLIINNYNTEELSQKQLTAIEKWVEKGGTLVIGTGEYAADTLSKLKETYGITEQDSTLEDNELPEGTGYTVTNFRLNQQIIQDLKQHILSYAERRNLILEAIKNKNEILKQNGKKPIELGGISPDQWAEESIQKLKIVSTEKKAADVTLQGCTDEIFLNNSFLMQKRSIEEGMVQLFGIDLGLDSETEEPLGAAILVSILDNMSDTKQQQLQKEYFGNYVSYNISSVISYTDAKEIPQAVKFAIVLVIYVFLLSPATFLLLRKFDKRNYTWFASPVLAVIFTLIVYFMGMHTRIKEPFAGYVDILDFKENNKADEEIYFALTAPYNNKYSVTLDKEYSITELEKNSYYSYAYNVQQDREGDLQKYLTVIDSGIKETRLEINKNPAFSPVYYQTKNSYAMENLLTYNIHYAGETVEGTVTNGYDFELSNVVLLSDGYLFYIGDLKQGETVSLADKENLFLTCRDIYYNNDLFHSLINTGDKETDKENSRITNILYYLGENKLLNKPDCNYLIAFVKGQEESFWQSIPQNTFIQDLSERMDCYGSKLIMVNVASDYTEGDRTFVPSIDSFMGIHENYYDYYYSYRYLTNDSKTVTYHFPVSDHIVSFEYLKNRNQEFNSDYQKNFEGKIYFLNNRTGNYDEVFQGGTGSSVTNVKDYLTDENTVTVRYSSDVSLQTYQMLLPYISYWKEAKSNAGD